MRRAAKIAGWLLGILIGLPLLGVIVLAIFANTGAGRATIETLTAKLSGGTVQLQGLSGRFPDALRLAHAEIHDKNGTWLTIDDVALDWSPLRLLTGEAAVETLSAARVAASRLPVSEGKSSPSQGRMNFPPLRIAVNDLQIGRIELAAPVAGVPAAVQVKGNLRLASIQSGAVALDVERLGGAGSYKLDGKMASDGDQLTLDVNEPAQGLLAEIAGLPNLGALSITARLDGPRDAARLSLDVAAGPMRANGRGTVDLLHQMVDIDLTGNAPAMTPRPDIAWQSVALDLHVHGPFTTPNATGRFEVDNLAAAGANIAQIAADLQGDKGKADLTASLSGVHVPGPQPDLFASAPIKLDAEAILDTPQRPVTFTISHPLLGVTGDAQTGGDNLTASATVWLQNLAPLAALGGADIDGHASFTANATRQGDKSSLDLEGALALTGGQAIATKLLGTDAKLSLAGTLQGNDVALDHVVIDGEGLHLSAKGTLTDGTFDLPWGLTVANVADLAPTLSGPLSMEGTLKGPQDNLALTVQSHGMLAAAGLPPGAIDALINASGVPAHPSGQIDLHGQLANSPLVLSAKAQRNDDGSSHLSLDRMQWKSIDAQGDLNLAPGAAFPLGQMKLRATRLADLAPLLGIPLSGAINATLDTTQANGAPQARVRAEAQQLAALGDSADRVTLDATIKDPATHPVAAAQLAVDGIAANGITGTARLDANGPQEALSLRLVSDLTTPKGPTHITAAATARLPQRELQLASLQAEYVGETVRLLAPARLRFADGMAVDQLRIGMGDAVLAIAGQFSPSLRLTASLRNVTPALAKPFVPDLNAVGSISADAQLGGTIAAPTGRIHVAATGLRARSGTGGAVPPADFDATADLRGNTARLDAKLNAGAMVSLRVVGTAPLDPSGQVDLRSSGRLDLAVLDPVLTAGGRSVHGQVTLDLGIAGSAQSPRANGSVRIANGSVQDFLQGIHITDIAGIINASGDTLRLNQLNGKAGDGTISINGTVGVFASGMPINLTVVAHNARPLASDLLTATMDSNLTVQGEVEGALNLGGTIHISRAEIQIPDSFPQSVAVLNVRRPGQQPPPVSSGEPINLDLTIDAPEQIFVRGHGLDAEMGGRLRINGTSTSPQISGGFDLRHGTFSLAGQSLTFTSGRVAFDGFGLSSKLDPTLNFVAQTTSNSITATLNITGYANSPKIRLSSVPDLPQDEILAQLLFGQSTKQLSPFQLLSIAQAIAAITGVGGSGDPLAAVRRGLGLDRLSVGAASGNGPGATVEAGKYVANGVYVGTRQGTSGGTQAQVQIDLTKRLKLESTIGTGGTPATGITPDNDPGSTIGLTYQFEY